MMTYAWMVAVKIEKKFTMRLIEMAWKKAIELGIILDNDLSTKGTQGTWYRCWIADPHKWMRLCANAVGENVFPDLMFRSLDKKSETYTEAYPTTEFFVLENATITDGSHFTGETKDDAYNPDTRLELVSIKNIRGWNIHGSN